MYKNTIFISIDINYEEKDIGTIYDKNNINTIETFMKSYMKCYSLKCHNIGDNDKNDIAKFVYKSIQDGIVNLGINSRSSSGLNVIIYISGIGLSVSDAGINILLYDKNKKLDFASIFEFHDLIGQSHDIEDIVSITYMCDIMKYNKNYRTMNLTPKKFTPPHIDKIYICSLYIYDKEYQESSFIGEIGYMAKYIMESITKLNRDGIIPNDNYLSHIDILTIIHGIFLIKDSNTKEVSVDYIDDLYKKYGKFRLIYDDKFIKIDTIYNLPMRNFALSTNIFEDDYIEYAHNNLYQKLRNKIYWN